jgi:hypothetical protein
MKIGERQSVRAAAASFGGCLGQRPTERRRSVGGPFELQKTPRPLADPESSPRLPSPAPLSRRNPLALSRSARIGVRLAVRSPLRSLRVAPPLPAALYRSLQSAETQPRRGEQPRDRSAPRFARSGFSKSVRALTALGDD